MNGWIVAIVIALVLTLAFTAVVVFGSVSQVKDLGRAARRFQDEVGGLASDISRDAARVSDRTSRLEGPKRARRS